MRRDVAKSVAVTICLSRAGLTAGRQLGAIPRFCSPVTDLRVAVFRFPVFVASQGFRWPTTFHTLLYVERVAG